jgi:hypothetical protein
MAERDGEFYVGYLATPPGLARWVRRAAVVLLALMLASGALIAFGQRDPGAAVWDTGAPVRIEGVLLEWPYPLIIDDEQQVHLLVQTGKRGAQSRASGLHGHRVRGDGWQLRRDDRRILELTDEPDALVTVDDSEADLTRLIRPPETTVVALHGEIVDAKCFLGAMKPGDGKAHKACATLCVSNGIPPMLALPRPGGGHAYYLVISADGAAATSIVTPLLGESVTVSGRVGSIGTLPTIAIEPGDVRRP